MNFIKLTTLFLLINVTLYAQVTEEQTSMSDGVRNAFIIDLDDANTKLAENVWKSYVGKIGKTKRDRKSKEWRSESIVIPAVDNSYNVNLTGKFEDLRGNARAYVWLRMDGSYINSEDYTNEARGVKTFLEDYALEVKKAAIGKEVEYEQKELKALEKDLDKLVKKNQGFHKDIKKAEEAIIKAEKNIDENVINQESKKIEIEEQKAALLKIQEKLKAVGKN